MEVLQELDHSQPGGAEEVAAENTAGPLRQSAAALPASDIEADKHSSQEDDAAGVRADVSGSQLSGDTPPTVVNGRERVWHKLRLFLCLQPQLPGFPQYGRPSSMFSGMSSSMNPSRYMRSPASAPTHSREVCWLSGYLP